MIHSILKDNLIPSEEYVFGIADLTGLINKKFGEYRFGISIGKKLDDLIIDQIELGPTIEYYNLYKSINTDLSDTAEKIKSELQKNDIDSIIIDPTIAMDLKETDQYRQDLTAEVSHKMVATRAGLGWIGKSDLLISKKFGPRLRFVSLLVNQKPLNFPVPIDRSRCGNCNICVERCPAFAASGKLWNIKVGRDEFFDAQKCREKCGELARQRLNINVRICGICVSVCPLGKRK